MGIKVRFDGLDVMAMVSHLNHTALGRRVINIYEGDHNDAFLFKLDHNVNTAQAAVAATAAAGGDTATATAASTSTAPPGGGDDDDQKEKLLLYLESGIRFHTTNRMQNNSQGGASNKSMNAPLAPFVFQLRKQLRGLRLESVTQLGQGDRVVHFVFGMGSSRRALLLELYAKGNIVLCDAQYNILTLLRSHQYGDESGGGGGGVQVQIGHVYPVTYAARNIVGADQASSPALDGDDKDSNNKNDNEVTNVGAESSAEEWAAWTESQVQQAAALAAAAKAAPEPELIVTPASATAGNNNNGKKGGGKKKGGKKDKQVGLVTLKTLLLKPSSGISHYGPNFLEHCILTTTSMVANLTPQTPLILAAEDGTNNLPTVADWEQFLQVLRDESAKLDYDPKAMAAAPPKGYILYSDKVASTSTEDDDAGDDANSNNNTLAASPDSFSNKVLEDFQPYLLLKQHEGRKVMEFDTYNEAVDTFFGHLEAQKRLLRAEAAEQSARDRLEKVRQDQNHRLQGLERDVETVQEQAQVVEYNADNVEKALQVINSALDSGMDWEQLEQLIQVEQEENHNPIALLIYQLELEHDTIILELPNAEAGHGDDDEEVEVEIAEEDTRNNKKKRKGKKGGKNGNNAEAQQKSTKRKVKKNHVLVSISLKETAHSNASQLFARYRGMKEKSQRTAESSKKALKAAEDNAQRQLADAQQKTKQATNTAVGQIIKPPWFTKFHWFITSDNYLVLGGRDAHQNEVLVKKYLRPGDAYLHADVYGAASCILRAKRVRLPAKGKNNKKKGATMTQTLPLSDQALREAGNFTICRSSAWASRMVTSAWWVESSQVSKTAPTGEYLKVGAFMIRGRKNFLPPTPLEMGLGVMFRLAAPEGTLDPATYARHKNERRDFALMELLQQQEDGDFDDDDGDDDDVDDEDNGGVFNGDNDNDGNNGSALQQGGKVDALEEYDTKESTGTPVASDTNEVKGDPSPADNTATPEEIKAEPEETLAAEAPPSPGKKKKKGLSVKDRKLIKKYGSIKEAEKVLAEREKEQQERDKEKDLLAQLAPEEDNDEDEDDDEGNNNQGTMKRGQRGKKKKAMKKYADQDNEDRELAMLALQGGEKVKKTKEKRMVDPTTDEQKQAAAETAALLVKDASEFAAQLPEDIRSVLAECVTVKNKDEVEAVVRWDKFDADVLEQLMAFEGPHEAKLAAAKRLLFLKSTTRVDNFSASLSGILRTVRKWGYKQLETDTSGADGSKRKTNDEKKAADAQWKETLAKEGVAGEDGEEEDAEIDDTNENNKLTGKPHAEDALLYAIPVCAPYSTLSQYTYRIKLTPGNLKRGKAARQCIDMFLKGDGTGGTGKQSKATAPTDIGKDFIKKVADNDWIQCLCADVKISAAGASKSIKKQKANIKSKAKKKK